MGTCLMVGIKWIQEFLLRSKLRADVVTEHIEALVRHFQYFLFLIHGSILLIFVLEYYVNL